MQVATRNRIVGYFFVVHTYYLTQYFCTKAPVSERFALQKTFLSIKICGFKSRAVYNGARRVYVHNRNLLKIKIKMLIQKIVQPIAL
jgi:hypothetical protein